MNEIKPRILQSRGAARREALLKAASEIFLESGYEKTALSEIIARSGGSKSFIYEQFGDKAGLFLAMMEERCADILMPLTDKVPLPADPREALTLIGRRFIDLICGPQALSLQRIAVAEGHRNPEVATAYFASGHDVAYAKMEEYLASISRVAMSAGDLHRLVVTFFAMIRGDVVERLVVGAIAEAPAAELDALTDLSVDWLMGRIGLS